MSRIKKRNYYRTSSPQEIIRYIMAHAKLGIKPVIPATDKVFAPFTPEQVKKLVEWQTGLIKRETPIGDFIVTQVHPFTCGGHACARHSRTDEGVLVPNITGWSCPCGEYKQYWCHSFMVK